MSAIKAEQKPTNEPNESSHPTALIDATKMSAGQRAALELTEAARDIVREQQGFAGKLFMGEFGPHDIDSLPEQTAEDRDQGDAFLKQLELVLREQVDPDEIDRTGEIPQPVIDALATLGAFGIKIPHRYGGLGLSQTNYCRAAMMLGAFCGNLTALLSAHQSIGVPQPLILFGTDEQKEKFLPRVAKGEISAFALTEDSVGSDPAKMKTHAEPTPDGKHFILNGEKLWCTNGTKAGILVVMARTPDRMINGKSKSQITAFIVEMDSIGIEVAHRCRFMGLKALYNGVIRFKDVMVPRENILLAEGKGLKVALTTLNTGRLTLPAACVGLSKRCLEITRAWAATREQWGTEIGKHAAIADKIARMASNLYAMESMTSMAAGLVDREKRADVRMEAAICKMWASEKAWNIVDETMQIRGGRGYETADSLRHRGEEPIAVERFMRDCRINMIFEGSSEIMRLFLAREALDAHLQRVTPILNGKLPWSKRLTAAVMAGGFYAGWYLKLWLPRPNRFKGSKPLRSHLRYVSKASRRLARALFHAMVRFGPKLDKQQLLLGRFVDIGADLFAMATCCARAQSAADTHQPEEQQLADLFCRESKHRIEQQFRALRTNSDAAGYRLARNVLEGRHQSLENGIMKQF